MKKGFSIRLTWKNLGFGAGIGLALFLAVWIFFGSNIGIMTWPFKTAAASTVREPAALAGSSQDSSQATANPESTAPARAVQPVVSPNTSASRPSSDQDASRPGSDQDAIGLLAAERNTLQPSKNPWVSCVVQPDPAIKRTFLLVASSEASARAFNAYFSFYFDGEDASADAKPVLILDRLFQETHRDLVIRDQTCAEPDLVDELEYWLKTLIDADQATAIREFIVACYQEDFAARLAHASSEHLASWQKSQAFTGLEVVFYAGRETYCTFEPD